jgi:4-hydroxy-3-polyprenylbenzoate decarboxylase
VTAFGKTCPMRACKTKGPSDVLDHATSEIASGSKPGIDETKKIPGEGFKRPWPPLIKMDAAVKAKVENLFNRRLAPQ